jgi:Fic family protein
VPGTSLQNQRQEIVYTPPQHPDDIQRFMDNLVVYINDDAIEDIDPLIKLAIIHHQFESIHPFYDGNGRTGRIINSLYLVIKDLLDLPILYLSRYIIQNKGEYYRLIQSVRDSGDWESWVLYILRGIDATATETIILVKQTKILMQEYKVKMRNCLEKQYSHELLNNIFSHPYTKIEFVMNDIKVSRITAAKYLNKLVEHGLLEKVKMGTSNFYLNPELTRLLINHSENQNIEGFEAIESISKMI